jgi:hypothetical protein
MTYPKSHHPIWVETGGLGINHDIQLMTFPSVASPPQRGKASNSSTSHHHSQHEGSTERRSIPLATMPYQMISADQHSQCINKVISELKITTIPKSFMKSTKAKSHYFW